MPSFAAQFPEAELSPRAARLLDALVDVRSRLVREIDPAEERALDRARVIDDANPPVFSATVVTEAGRSSVLVPLDPETCRPRCEDCPPACAHALAAIEELVDWLTDPEHPRRAELLDAVAEPPWTRWLDTFDEGLAELRSAERARKSARLWWQVDLEKMRLTPHVGSGGRAPRRVRLEEVEAACAPGPEDARALAAGRVFAAERRTAAREGRERQAFLDALWGLVDHPRVSLGPPGGTPTRVAAWPIELGLHERPGGLEIEIRARGVRVPSEALAEGASTLLFERPEEGELGLVRVERPLSHLLKRIAKSSAPVPPEARAALVQRLAEASVHVAIATSDELREIDVPARPELAALLTPLPEGGLHVALHAQPIEGGPLFRPGLGPAAALSATEDREVLRATRDFDAERTLAAELLRELEVRFAAELDVDAPFGAALPELGEALAAADALRADPRVVCQWPEAVWYPPVSVTTESLHLRVESKRDWLDLHGEARVDEKRLELAVLIEAARRDRGYVVLDDGRFARLQDALRTRLLELAAHVERRKRQLRVALGGVDALRALEEEGASTTSGGAYAELVRRIEAAATLEPALPSSLQGILRPYQEEGFRWMARLASWGAGAVLADDMGLGKTLQAIAVLLRRAAEGPQLVVAPTSVGFNWRRELHRFAPELRVLSYAGPSRAEALDDPQPGQVFVTSYGVVLRDVDALRAVGWTTLVLDEAQALKNPKTRRARAARALPADWVLALTGTPVENHPADLWALFRVVYPGLLGSFDAFRERYLPEVAASGSFSVETRAGEAEAPTLASSALRRAIAPFVLRRTKSEVARELPPRTDVVIDVTLSARERALYDDARLAAIAEMEKAKVSEDTRHHPKVLAALTRLRQLACHPRLVDPRSRVPSSKLERFLQIVHDLRAEGRRALVFSQFVKHLQLAREALLETGVRLAVLDGSTPAELRQKRVDAFQSGDLELFLISLKAGGVGLNLTAADTVVLLDPWWNPAVEDQAADRAHRLGQTQPVTVLRLIARGTVEEKMLEVHAEKRRLFSKLLEGSAAPGGMSADELAALIKA